MISMTAITNEPIVKAGEEITAVIADRIEQTSIETVEIRSVLTCESKKGVCVKCYGRNLATGRMTERGDAVGIIAAQSIGEPGTQLTLRTFHTGGAASGMATESELRSKFDGVLKYEDLRTATYMNGQKEKVTVVIGRSAEARVEDPKSDRVLISTHIPYGSVLLMKEGEKISKGQTICTWDPYNAVILSDIHGVIAFEHIIEAITYREEMDEQTGHKEKVIIEMRDKTKIPTIKVIKGKEEKNYNLPVGAHIEVEEGDEIEAGMILVKIPRTLAKLRGDITGGLPRVTELFEARNPSNPAVVSEIDGVVAFGNIKRGNREILITSKDNDERKYLVPLSKLFLIAEGDFVHAGQPLSDGAITPNDILNIKGVNAVQEYMVNEIQEVYRLQGVKINDKHIEVIVRQMMRKMNIVDPGDTKFLEGEPVDKFEFLEENERIQEMKVVSDAGDSKNLRVGSDCDTASNPG